MHGSELRLLIFLSRILIEGVRYKKSETCRVVGVILIALYKLVRAGQKKTRVFFLSASAEVHVRDLFI